MRKNNVIYSSDNRVDRNQVVLTSRFLETREAEFDGSPIFQLGVLSVRALKIPLNKLRVLAVCIKRRRKRDENIQQGGMSCGKC